MSSPAFVLVAGLEPDSDAYWEAVTDLQRRGDRATFEAAVHAVTSSDVRCRVAGIDVLGQLGVKDGHPFLDETLPLVVAATGDPDVMVATAAVTALGHLGDERALAAVLARRSHADADVRRAVAEALAMVAGDPPAEEAVAALVELTVDADPDVRDWATFELGTVLEVDSPAVREALAARLDDDEGDTAGEALVGLAVRGDARAFEPVLHLLQRADCGNLIVEAAVAVSSSALLPALLRLKALGWDVDDPRGHLLDEAIAACSQEA